MFPATSTRVRFLLRRFGQEAVISRKVAGGIDRLNHSTGSYEMVGTTLCALYNPDTAFGKTGAGELGIDEAALAFPTDTDIRPDDHITIDGVDYEIEGVNKRPTHTVATAKSI